MTKGYIFRSFLFWHFFFHLFLGQLQILNFEPNCSPSSSVLGRWRHRVSGRNNAVMPPMMERVPIITSGTVCE